MRRKGGVPPMVTVLVTIASIVAAGLVAWFLYTTTRSAVNQPVVEATAAYALCSSGSCTVYVNLRNIGSVTLANVTATLSLPGASQPVQLSCNPGTLEKGQSTTCTGPTGSIADGTGAVVTVTGRDSSNVQHSIPIAVKITVP